MSLIPQILPSEKPYWIIVSDEGPSTHPRRHDTFDSAQAESVRLAKLYPEREFGVFKYQGRTKATPTTMTVTKYVNLYWQDNKVITGGIEFTTEGEARRFAFWQPEALKTVPVELKTPAEQKVTYSTY